MPSPNEDRTEHISVAINHDLLAMARRAGTDLSDVLERALKLELLSQRPSLSAEDHEAIAAHNRLIAEHGLLSDEWRKF